MGAYVSGTYSAVAVKGAIEKYEVAANNTIKKNDFVAIKSTASPRTPSINYTVGTRIKINKTTHIIAFRATVSGLYGLYAQVIKSDGINIQRGTPLLISENSGLKNNRNISICSIDENRVIISYGASLKCAIMKINGLEIGIGNIEEIDSDKTTSSDYRGSVSSVTVISSNKAMIAYNRDALFDNIKIAIVNFNYLTITSFTTHDISTPNISKASAGIALINTKHGIIIVYNHGISSSQSNIYAAMVSLQNDVPTLVGSTLISTEGDIDNISASTIKIIEGSDDGSKTNYHVIHPLSYNEFVGHFSFKFGNGIITSNSNGSIISSFIGAGGTSSFDVEKYKANTFKVWFMDASTNIICRLYTYYTSGNIEILKEKILEKRNVKAAIYVIYAFEFTNVTLMFTQDGNYGKDEYIYTLYAKNVVPNDDIIGISKGNYISGQIADVITPNF